MEVAIDAMQSLGGNGYINGAFRPFCSAHSILIPFECKDYPTGRILRDARLYCVGAGTQEIRRMLIGREFNIDFGAA